MESMCVQKGETTVWATSADTTHRLWARMWATDPREGRPFPPRLTITLGPRHIPPWMLLATDRSDCKEAAYASCWRGRGSVNC